MPAGELCALGRLLSVQTVCNLKSHLGLVWHAGPPWPHVAVLLLLLLGVRSHSLVAVLALALACVLAVLHARGLRWVALLRYSAGDALRAPGSHGTPEAGRRVRLGEGWCHRGLMEQVRRVMMRVDTGGRLGFAVIRHGAPVEGLAPGARALCLTRTSAWQRWCCPAWLCSLASADLCLALFNPEEGYRV